MLGWADQHGRRWLAVFAIGYAIRAVVWICGSNLPLVPGDSCHYLEVATSVLRGEGPVKHYVGSFFTGLSATSARAGAGSTTGTRRSTPTSGVRVAARRSALAIHPSKPESPSRRHAASFSTSSACRRSTCSPGGDLTPASGALGAWPCWRCSRCMRSTPGFVLRESLVVLTSILAVWTLTEVWHARRGRRRPGPGPVAGLCGGLAVMARNTASHSSPPPACSSWSPAAGAARPLSALGRLLALVILPGRSPTCWRYDTPVSTRIPRYFEFNFSWTIHHYEKGNTRPSQFYTTANLPEIVRVKVKSLLIIVVYSTMIVGPADCRGILATAPVERAARDAKRRSPGRDDLRGLRAGDAQECRRCDAGRAARALLLAGLRAGVADGGRRAHGMAGSLSDGQRVVPWLAAGYIALVWADPTWAYDASWLVKRFQLHWPALAQRRRLDPGPSGSGSAACTDHDLVSLGAARHEPTGRRS